MDEDFVEVDSHSLTEDGVIEEYYITYKGKSVTIQANEVTEEKNKPRFQKDLRVSERQEIKKIKIMKLGDVQRVKLQEWEALKLMLIELKN